MNATVMCEKCGKPLGVFEGNICNECENKEINDVLDKIRDEIAEYKDDMVIHAERNEMIDIVLELIDKYR